LPDLFEARSRLSPAKRAILEKALRGGLKDVGKVLGIPRRLDNGPVSLSFSQARLWFLAQLAPESFFFNEIDTVRFDFAVDVTVLERSLNEIVRRHEALRTTFEVCDGEPVQVVAPTLSIPLPLVDLCPLPKEEREAGARRLVDEETRRPFDLAHGPLVRSTLIKMGEDDYVFVLAMHHIICDGWSMGIFWDELSAVWWAFAVGKPSPLPELPIQYADFAVWQRARIQGELLQSQLAYWRKQLTDLPTLELPVDRPRPAVQTFSGARESLQLSPRLAAALTALSQREGVTLFMTLLAAFKTLLHRYTGQEDLAIGTFIANRTRAEIEKLIGFFVNSLVLRTNLEGNPTFRELLAHVREVTLGAYAHQDLPFEKLVEEIQPERDLGRNPLFQVVFQLVNLPTMKATSNSADDGFPDVERGTAILDIVFHMWEEHDGSLGGLLEYNTDLFEALTIRRLLEHFRNLLQSIVARPEAPLSELRLISMAERQQVLVEWNATEKPYPLDRSLGEVFEQQVARRPQATAFLCDGAGLTYADLDRRSNQLGQHLRAVGVGPETLVGIFLDRSFDMVVALLAVLKAGGAYLPLDPSYPEARVTFMLKDSGAPVVLTRKSLTGVFAGSTTEIVCVDTDEPVIRKQSASSLRAEVTPRTLAYVIYTSGSTGKPKGVAVEHRQILNRLAWMWETYPFAQDEVGCQKTPLGFVDSIWELLGPLLQGVPTVIIPERIVKDPYALVTTLREHRCTRLWLVPSLLGVLLDTHPNLQRDLPALRFWVSSGEALTAELVERFERQMPESVLYNLYGTSEIWDATWYDPRTRGDELSRVPIGRPINNVQTYILDRYLQPVPIGGFGELHVGGHGLARGYLNRPELTAEKFISHPFSENGTARLYKTGDCARYLPDGNIEFLGRIDQQVKLRGFRIELAEVESALAEYPGIRQAAVTVREDTPGDQRLVAYVTQNPDFESGEDGSASEAWGAELIPEWQSVWDAAYGETSSGEDPTVDTSGLTSNYTGLPIDPEQVRHWVDHAVQRVLSLAPGRVLEIGCGGGLLLFRIAPSCEQYWGTDFSAVALDRVRQHLRAIHQDNVRLLQRNADDLSQIEEESFDAIVLHSVVQYFPGVDYLLRVLEGAIRRVRPGGSIFVGDVRSLPLLPAFQTSVELYRAADTLRLDHLEQRVRKRLTREKELVLDPEFFLAVGQRFREVSSVRVELKRGRDANEFTRYRYDVMLQVGGHQPEPLRLPRLDWRQESLQLADLRRILQEKRPEGLNLSGVPNARVEADVLATQMLSTRDGSQTVGGLRQALGTMQRVGIDPEDVRALAGEFGYEVAVSWSDSGAEGRYDVELCRTGVVGASLRTVVSSASGIRPRPWHHYANNPLQGKFTQRLVPELRNFLKERLPDHMLPSAFVLLDELPQTPSGKINRRGLPPPDRFGSESEESYVAPRTVCEERLVKVWGEVLGFSRIGVHDNFFSDLGGHSLLATRLLSRLRDTFEIELPLRAIFDSPTVAGLAQLIPLASGRDRGGRREPAITRISREQHRVTLSSEGGLSSPELLDLPRIGSRKRFAEKPEGSA
jgi:amino acid adenylation domain-containing protein